ncbi:hypothetical protein D9757_003535 [Collybiopsis confluens]|uniref:CRAL-TRIO domain-containing protein n=1 Tax=Collybiopsis confluens TaxID=2823264 RepID=A0A8H5HU36_9AGAR|nr:hypothetical protein D9757_003535 [Collybiopsis confluens]
MFTDAQNWRKKVGLDELYKNIDPFDYLEREAVFNCWPMWFHKTDKQGRPLNFHFLGGLDLERLNKEGVTPERHWETVLVNAECLTREILPAAARKYEKEIDSVFVIVDLKGFGLSKFWQMKNLAQRSFQISQDYYPETMGRLAILNAPSSFTLIWNVIRPWLAKETANKVDILGPDYREKLLESIDEENLPWAVGGKCRCETEDGHEGPRCHLSANGPWLDGRAGWGPNAQKAQTNVSEKSNEIGDPSESKNSTNRQRIQDSDAQSIYANRASEVEQVKEEQLEASSAV